jgi:S1-C subfamily serine protease
VNKQAWAAIVALATLTACAPDPPSAIVQVAVRGCQPGIELGTGAFVDDRVVLTAAHTLRGAREITVSRGDQTVPGLIVGFDPGNDLAYLRAEIEPHNPLTVDARGVDRGASGDAWVVREGVATRLDVTVVRRININTEDIYIDEPVTRPGFELEADIRPGDSGGPVLVDGEVIGVLWARSRRAELRAYAIDPDRGGDLINRQLIDGDLGDADPGRCS